MTIKELQEQAYAIAERNGFWSTDLQRNRAQKLMLIVSELVEAMEELRNGHGPREVYYSETGKPEGYSFELADVAIRLADLAQYDGIDLGARIAEKMAYNATRPYKHNKVF